MWQSPGEQLRTNCFYLRKEKLNRRMINYLNAYGIPNAGDNIVMNLIYMQMLVDDFYSYEGMREFNDIILEYHNLQDIGRRVLSLRKS